MTTWLTAQEAADHARITPGHLRRLIREGRLYRGGAPGGRVLIDRGHLDEQIEAGWPVIRPVGYNAPVRPEWNRKIEHHGPVD